MIDFLLNGGSFAFPQSSLLKLASRDNKKKRNPAIPSSAYPNYKIIKKASQGTKFDNFQFGGYDPLVSKPEFSYNYDPIDNYSSLDAISYSLQQSGLGNFAKDDSYSDAPLFSKPIKSKAKTKLSSRGDLYAFNVAFDRAVRFNPELAKYRKLLTGLAEAESSFKADAKNPNYDAYGYFLFVLNNNIDNVEIARKYSLNPDTFNLNEFLSNPEMQILAAGDLIKLFESLFTKEDLALAKKKGYSKESLIAGCWLGGMSGVRKVLSGTGNPSDRHHSPTNSGSDVKTYMQKFA